MRTATRSTPEGLALAERLALTRGRLSGAALAVAAVWPAAHAEDGPVVCPLRLLTGLPCPVCGMTRSFVYTLHGRLGDAFAAHAFGPALVALAAVWLVLGRRAAGDLYPLHPPQYLGTRGVSGNQGQAGPHRAKQ